MTSDFNVIHGSRAWQEAADLAAFWHAGQKTSDLRTCFIAHPVRVALIVACEFDFRDPEVLAAALLHDVLEKSEMDAESLRKKTGERVAGMVESLSKNCGGPRSRYWDRLEAASWEARLVKLADALDHLDCPPSDLARRVKSARKALGLAFTLEAPLQLAKRKLSQAVERAAGQKPRG